MLAIALGYVRCLLHIGRGFLKIQDEISPKLCDLCGLGVEKLTRQLYLLSIDKGGRIDFAALWQWIGFGFESWL